MVATLDADEGAIGFAHQADRRPRIMYDVSYEEWLAFREKPPISQDDVLDIHRFLADFDGDFEALFGRNADIADTPEPSA